ncbi:hypothetical protein ACIQWN_37065 [Streptomyces vinaceus]|uniref:hypothetical protein n=1 Tax=Streptomyces vinaceus TaxID=1960 RepID=UPI00382E3BFE
MNHSPNVPGRAPDTRAVLTTEEPAHGRPAGTAPRAVPVLNADLLVRVLWGEVPHGEVRYFDNHGTYRGRSRTLEPARVHCAAADLPLLRDPGTWSPTGFDGTDWTTFQQWVTRADTGGRLKVLVFLNRYDKGFVVDFREDLHPD